MKSAVGALFCCLIPSLLRTRLVGSRAQGPQALFRGVLKLFCACAAPGISASPAEDNLRYFNVMILGPQQSPYEGARQLYFSSTRPCRKRCCVKPSSCALG